ncbi:hypothetical protein MSAN_00422500 [Mycena sanguinolenta]|uniref:Uncharacterized protein n=1 Tax=Mycena sanguinolenta TaxID=230812 RepID=A0A8H6ZDF9_9AGAR|nr:hypothetical protein MSAN_00422500 [Mycena sanguinolenta]
MGGLPVLEVIVEYAPPALNLLANLINWLSESDLVAVASTTANGNWPRVTMRKGKMVTVKDNPNPDVQSLTNEATGKVYAAFQHGFGYPFNGDDSDPPTAQKQGGSPTQLTSNEDFVTCSVNNEEAINTYIDTFINDNVPTWAQTKLRNDVLGMVNARLNGAETNAWLHYGQPEIITGGASGSTLRADIMMLYCVTDAPDPQNKSQIVKTLFCKFVGVYYLSKAWPSLTAQDDVAPGTAQILAIDCSVSDATLATALGVQIVRTQPSSVNTIFSVSSETLCIVIAVKCATDADWIDTGSQQNAAAPLHPTGSFRS